jgi:methylthioribose-1-phosphate isomerase
MKESILFWPVRLEGTTLMILDETKIPQKITYLKVKDLGGAIDAVVEMKTRAFGQFLTVCYTFVLELKKAKDKDARGQMAVLEKVAIAFNNSRPTFPFEEVTSMMLGFARKAALGPDFSDGFIAGVEGFLEKGIRQQRYRRAEEASRCVKDGDAVLTHCHVSGEMSLIGEFCRRDSKKVRFFATETRPYFQGSRLTAWELQQEGFDVTLVPDNAVAQLMRDGKVACVIVGSDRSAKNGDFANKIGTYQIALLAKHFHIPFYVLVQPSDKLQSGEDIPIEIRDEKELLFFEGRRLAPKGARAFYPGFDVVPHALVTRHIAIHTHQDQHAH